MIRNTAVSVLATFALAACGSSGDEPGGGPDAGTMVSAADGGAPVTQAMASADHMPSDADRAAILTTVQSLFDALGERDTELLTAILHPDILMRSVERSAEGERSASTSTLEGMVARLEADGPRMTERMWDPEVRISGDLATVWTPYDFYVGEDLSHCGADAFILMRDGGDWQITSLSWTRLQPPECELHPDGPPN
ncbi:MAG: nuclear transport factor 2 family protein [Gammaproteobacteria bacterium]|nr:nuclear transport factor 2 family protein [Gammaproteobacteria bacterium]MXY29655.1 nuclear transport factor 2 family protein [Gammaproteobacteria bacterium]MYD00013.1 nuclear transport factor 2 family protein [Gammaproteobacteria bacterium]MYF60549.1 nuclear transport factor 2 family protein [Gammaproteobacteria bacterium]MYI22960.1 nuclear transport factor 2 family protein [Gammaproteobacteria bacterium]